MKRRLPLKADDDTEEWSLPPAYGFGTVTTLDRNAAPEEPLPDPEPIGFLRFPHHTEKKRTKKKRAKRKG